MPEPASLDHQAAVGIAAVFLGHAGELDDAAVTRYLEPSLGAPRVGSAVWALNRLGIGPATARRLATRSAFDAAVDGARTVLLADGAYVVLRDDGGLVRLAVRDHGDHYGIEPGAELGVVLGARIRVLARQRRTVGGLTL